MNKQNASLFMYVYRKQQISQIKIEKQLENKRQNEIFIFRRSC